MRWGTGRGEPRWPADSTWAIALAVVVAVVVGGVGLYFYAGGGGSAGEVAGSKIAVTGSVDGGLVIRVLTCPGERVRQVELDLTDRKFDSTEKVLWKIESSTGGSVSEFTVGQAPFGFTTIVPAQVPRSAQYFVVGLITEGHGQSGFGLNFSRNDVSSESLYVGSYSIAPARGRQATVEQFESVRDKVCKGQLKPLGG